MANVKLIFCSDELQTIKKEMKVFAIHFDDLQTSKINISIDDLQDSDFSLQNILLDKETAVKFSRELRKQIALLP